MAKAATLTIDIVADVAKATKNLEKIDGKLSTFGKAFTGAAIAGGAAVVGGALLGLGKSALEAAEDGRKLSQATEAIIKATGGAAGVSTKYIEDYAAELARLTGVDDELIQSGQNLLLTFKSVKNETKDGSGVFDRATRAALDLAAAGFGSVESNATQLGKALENPTKGVTALARAGVTFTDQEKEKIATLQASGNLLEAQQIVLAAVEGQVTGTAEASASATDRMSVAWEQALGTIGEALLPVIDKLLPVFVELLDKLVPAVMPVVELIADLAGMLIDALMPALEPLFPVIRELALVIGRELKVVIAQIAPLLPGLVQSFARLLTAVIPLIPPFIQTQTAMLPLLPVITRLITLAVDLVTVALVPLLGAVVKLQAGMSGGLERVISSIARAINGLIGPIKSAIDWVGRLIDKIARIKPPSLGKIGGFLGGLNPFSVPAAGGVSSYGGGSTRMSTTSRIKVDVTGVGFDSILTGRALASQITKWDRRNGLTPLQWANRGGLPAGG